MKKLSILLLSTLVALTACTKSKEVHPEIGDGNDEIVTVGMMDVHVEYFRNNMEKLEKVYFNYRLASSPNDPQHHTSAEMTKREDHFELTLTDLLCDTLYSYYYTLMDDPGGPGAQTESKTFRTQACDTPQPPTPPVAELPTVVTAEVLEITTYSAQCGGEVTDDGGAEVTERGICWGINENPTLEDNYNAIGTGTGVFTMEIDGLQANTTYHVRAYAINEAGTAYGLDKEFSTLSGGGSGVPEGAINGLFTINGNGKKVYFSKGNLQYQASTNTWRFAENQWDYIGTQTPDPDGDWGGNVEGSDNASISSNYSGWIDLFGWGTSGWNNGNICYHPWDCLGLFSGAEFVGHGYGPIDSTFNTYDLTGMYANADWGVYNPISNGGNIPNQWRTLTFGQWYYVFNIRTTTSGIQYAKAQVNNVNGVILLPDDWNTTIFSLNNPNTNDASFSSNIISVAQWTMLENAGAVFLPAGGNRGDTTVWSAGVVGLYWSTSRVGDDHASGVYFSERFFEISGFYRYGGVSLRLVQEVNQ